MTCKKCASNNQRYFKSEMSIAFRGLENIDRTPIYLCQDVPVCLDCGHLELALPPAKLELLKKWLVSNSEHSFFTFFLLSYLDF